VRPPSKGAVALREVVALMLRLGFTAFGGPAAHIAMLEREVVQQRRWLTPTAFLDLLGATNLIPGPNSTEMMIHMGMSRAGVPGLWLAGLAFILPAALITLGFAALYVATGTLPAAQGVMAGIKPAVLAIIAAAVWQLGRKAVKNTVLALLGAAVLGLYLWQGHELALLLGSGVLGILLGRTQWTVRSATHTSPTPPETTLEARTSEAEGERQQPESTHGAAAGAAPTARATGPLRAAAVPLALVSLVFFVAFVFSPLRHAVPTPTAIGLFFLKIGSVLFGGGYVLLAFVREGLVQQYGWLTEQQLLDAVAVGQFTPGPVFSTATFIGYLIAGVPGAVAATVGIFLPSFFFVWATHPLVPRMRASAWASGFLDGVNVGSVALMAGVCLQLGRSTLTTWPAALVALVALVIVLRTRVNSAWVLLAAALLGPLLR
jgi:chromate transporter